MMHSYSRKIIWLEVLESNNDPLFVTHYYLKAVENLQGIPYTYILHACDFMLYFLFIGCPRFMRTDLGSENSSIAFIQPFHLGNSVSHFYGKSTMNQVSDSGLYYFV